MNTTQNTNPANTQVMTKEQQIEAAWENVEAKICNSREVYISIRNAREAIEALEKKALSEYKEIQRPALAEYEATCAAIEAE